MFTSSTRHLHRKYDPSLLPEPILKRKDLEWIWRRPDPAPMPKTLTRQLEDGSKFHQFLHRPPLYSYIRDPKLLTADQAEQILPPAIHDRRHGQFGYRELSEDDVEQIKQLRSSRTAAVAADRTASSTSVVERMPWGIRSLADRFQCSREQIIAVCHKHIPDDKPTTRKSRREIKWRWWHIKRYQSAQIEYGPNGNHRQFNNS